MNPVRSAVIAAALALGVGATLAIATPSRPTSADVAASSPPTDAALAKVARGVLGRSGALRVVVADAGQGLNLPLEWSGDAARGDAAYRWLPVLGTSGTLPLGSSFVAGGFQAPAANGVWRLRLVAGGETQDVEDVAVVTRVPLSAKRGGFLNGYRIGTYVTEGQDRGDGYDPPPGFIEVTPENQDLLVSEHFRLRNFLTKDQFDVWPKYVAVDLKLIDKLELVMQELNAMGIRAEQMTVMSGFRTPAYNVQGVREGGRALLSRHTYGDASDVWIDSDRDGYIDDLNGDGVCDVRDAEVILRAVDRVEARYPELAGGAGVYTNNGPRSPFVHIDTRGHSARW